MFSFDFEVETVLETYSNIITPYDFENASLTVKNTFTSLNENMLSAMCRSVGYGQSPTVAVSSAAILMVVKKEFDSVANNSVVLPTCASDSSSSCDTPDSHVVLGKTLEDMYKTWQCGSETCTGKI